MCTDRRKRKSRTRNRQLLRNATREGSTVRNFPGTSGRKLFRGPKNPDPLRVFRSRTSGRGAEGARQRGRGSGGIFEWHHQWFLTFSKLLEAALSGTDLEHWRN